MPSRKNASGKGKKEVPMKKLVSVLAVAMLVGAFSSWAQTTNVVSNTPITLKALLTDGTHVTEADLAGTGDLSFMQLQIINGSTTNEIDVLAKSVVVGTSSNLTSATILLEEQSVVDLAKGKSVEVFKSTGVDPNINGAAWFVNGMTKGKKDVTTFSGKVVGVWKDTETAFAGSSGTIKSK
jgi:hypothetical protein